MGEQCREHAPFLVFGLLFHTEAVRVDPGEERPKWVAVSTSKENGEGICDF
jgi:hypothetical protein